MWRFSALGLAFLATCAAAGDWPETGPRPSTAPIRSAHGLPSTDGDETSPSPLMDFRQKLRKLQEEREALKEDRKKIDRWVESDGDGVDLSKLRYRLTGLLAQMATTKGREPHAGPPLATFPPPETRKAPDTASPGAAPHEPHGAEAPAAKIDAAGPIAAEPATPRFTHAPDSLALGMALFKAGNYGDALRALSMVSLEKLRTEERMPVKYLLASCLRKQGKTDEALKHYLDIANYTADAKLASCAQAQIASLRWEQDVRRRLQNVRERRAALEVNP